MLASGVCEEPCCGCAATLCARVSLPRTHHPPFDINFYSFVPSFCLYNTGGYLSDCRDLTHPAVGRLSVAARVAITHSSSRDTAQPFFTSLPLSIPASFPLVACSSARSAFRTTVCATRIRMHADSLPGARARKQAFASAPTREGTGSCRSTAPPRRSSSSSRTLAPAGRRRVCEIWWIP